jgi:hypothetical protein
MASLRNPPFTVQPMVIQELKDDFEKLFETTIDMEKERYRHGYSTVEQPRESPEAAFDEDPLALSIMSYFVWKNNPHRRWADLREVGRPTLEARELAHEIRKYYLHRNTMKVLMGQTPTEFQNKMNGFLADTRPLRVDELGILYRIPYFYQEDLGLDRVFEGATNILEVEGVPFSNHITLEARLTPVREVLRSRRAGDYVQFWFSDINGQRHTYDVKADNKLITVFRSLFRQPELLIKAGARLEVLRGSHIPTRYWRLVNLELQ